MEYPEVLKTTARDFYVLFYSAELGTPLDDLEFSFPTLRCSDLQGLNWSVSEPEIRLPMFQMVRM